MEQTPHERLCAIFEEAVNLKGLAQQEFVTKACGDDPNLRQMVEKMLRADNADSESGIGVAVDVNLEEAFGTQSLPKQIGPYQITRKIGAGGMGIVYEAQQEKPQRFVALKVMRFGASKEQAARFELESEVLGWLQHPYIAHVYGAGTAITQSGPQPWISMELVEGLPIDDFGKKNALTLAQTLELVTKVLEGVSHAHSKGVVHRDLKPGNVLVDERGDPHIVDFGVARVVDGWNDVTRTQSGDIVGTLAYMSPEQVSGDPKAVSTQSDVYSVGTMAFELLAGELPLALEGKSTTQAIETIREGRKKSLGSHFGMAQDLDSVVSKALDLDPERRYQTADAFADDLRRFIQGDAIMARPPSALYQLKCFGRRNKVASFAIGAALFAIVAGAAFSTYRFYKEREANDRMEVALKEASDARDEALKQEELANKGLAFYGTMISRASRSGQGTNLTVLDMINQAAQEVPDVFPDAPEKQAHLLMTFSISNFTAGRRDQALENIETVIDLIEGGRIEDPMFANAAYLQYSVVCESLNRGPESIAAAKKAVTVLEGAQGERESWGRARAAQKLALRHAAVGDYQSGLDAIAKAVDDIGEFGERPGFAGVLLLTKGEMLTGLGRNKEGVAALKESIIALEGDGLGSGPKGLKAKQTLGICYLRMGDTKEALLTFAPLIEAERKVNGASDRLAVTLRMIAECHAADSNHREAVKNFDEALEIMTAFQKRPDLISANIFHQLGRSYRALNETGKAIEAYGQGILALEGSSNPAQLVVRASLHASKAGAQKLEQKFEEALASTNASIEDFDACQLGASGLSSRLDLLYLRATILEDLENWKEAGRAYYEILSTGVEHDILRGLWPGSINALKGIKRDHPMALDGYVEDVGSLLTKSELLLK